MLTTRQSAIISAGMPDSYVVQFPANVEMDYAGKTLQVFFGLTESGRTLLKVEDMTVLPPLAAEHVRKHYNL